MADVKNEYDQYSAQTSGKLFNSAMFGFNKEEVLEYLEEMAEENFQRQEAAEHRIRELAGQLQVLEANAANQQIQSAQSDGLREEERRQFEDLKNQVELSRAATQQAEDELQEYREQLLNAQKENAWLREEYQKSDQLINDLHRQLDELTAGQWPADNDQVQQLQARLHQAETALEAARAQLAEQKAAPATPPETAASIIIEEANEQADRIREEAWAERDRLQRQLQTSAGGLVTSISNLRGEISDVEGDVSGVLETVQTTLADLMAALGRTEQNLATYTTQVDRFPASAPAVVKPQQQVVYFQPGAEIEPSTPQRVNWRATPQQSLGGGGFRRVWPDGGAKKAAPAQPFRPTYTGAPAGRGFATNGAEAYQLDTNPEERMRTLAENLVDTLVQMMHEG